MGKDVVVEWDQKPVPMIPLYFSQGWLEGVQGGNMFHGMMVGAISGAGGHYIDKKLNTLGKAGEIAASAVLGGTVDELGGGKFANGAITSAFSIMFNDMMHQMQSKRREIHDLVIYGRKAMKNRIAAMKLMVERSRFTGKEVAAAFLEDGNVVIYHDKESTEDSSYFYYNIDNNGKLQYRGVDIKGFVHTHPDFNLNKNASNPLRISIDDISNAISLGQSEINVLFLNGDYFSQGISGNSIYQPNLKYNIYKYKR